jgi:hypothetical protein
MKKTFEFGKPGDSITTIDRSSIPRSNHHEKSNERGSTTKNTIDYSSIERGKDHNFYGPTPKEDSALSTTYKKISTKLQQNKHGSDGGENCGKAMMNKSGPVLHKYFASSAAKITSPRIDMNTKNSKLITNTTSSPQFIADIGSKKKNTKSSVSSSYIKTSNGSMSKKSISQ